MMMGKELQRRGAAVRWKSRERTGHELQRNRTVTMGKENAISRIGIVMSSNAENKKPCSAGRLNRATERISPQDIVFLRIVYHSRRGKAST